MSDARKTIIMIAARKTIIMIAQGLDPAVFREGVRHALTAKVNEAARVVRRAARALQDLPDERLHDVEGIRAIAAGTRENACAFVAALEALELAIAEHDEALAALDHPEPLPGLEVA
jgi:hypothetical protein